MVVSPAPVKPRPASPGRRPGAIGPTALPQGVTERMLADSDAIARRLARRLAEEIPLPEEYAGRAYFRLVLRACRDGLRALLRQLHDGRRAHPAELIALGRAGAAQAEMDVPLDVLLRGYRVAAKVVWREVVDEAVRLGELSPPMVVNLSEQVLEYLDGLSGAVGSAYLETRERRLRRMDRERDHLLQRLFAGDASAELRRLAATAGLELAPPYCVLAVAVADSGAEARSLAGAWRAESAHVALDEPGRHLALVSPGADPHQLHHAAQVALRCPIVLAIGPCATTLEQIGPATQLARDTLRLGQRLDPERTLHDHQEIGFLAPLLSDPEDLRTHVLHVLGPLLEPRRAELLATLQEVVESHGPAEAAERLGVHRHTVAYRLGSISELLGVDVDDPEARHRMWLALRLARLL